MILFCVQKLYICGPKEKYKIKWVPHMQFRHQKTPNTGSGSGCMFLKTIQAHEPIQKLPLIRPTCMSQPR